MRRRRRARRFAIALATTFASAIVFAAAAAAALVPGTPLPVSPGVPDQGRAWELVTAPDPNWAPFFNEQAVSVDGNRIFYMTGGVLPEASTNESIFVLNRAVRGADGWASRTWPRPVPNSSVFPEIYGIDSSLENVLWTDATPPGEEGSEGYYRRGPDGELIYLHRWADGSMYLGDGQHALFQSSTHLLPADASRTTGASIYEMVGTTLRLVDVDNDGKLLSDCGSNLREKRNIFGDGKRVFFSTAPGCSGPARVFLRENAATTTEISASQCDLPGCGPEPGAEFLGATGSGSSAFLGSNQRLTNDDPNVEANDIYRYDVASGRLSLVTRAGGSEVSPRSNLVTASNDGSRLYFDGIEDTGLDTFVERRYLADAGGIHIVPGCAPSGFMRISADGRYALYETSGQLVAGDTDAGVDVYRFDAQDHAVTRVSAGPTGGNGAFDAKASPGEFNLDFPDAPYQAMSEDGNRIFFTTVERLLPQDQNEVRDVYEWVNGSLGLVSSGQGIVASNYLGMSSDGATVFFSTANTLLPLDRDGGDWDIYAARIGGGFPEPATRECEGSACQSVRQERLEREAPATVKPRGGGIRLLRIGPAARRRIAITGWITMLAEVPRAGRLSAEARAGRGRRMVASTSLKVRQPGPVRLRMRLSRSTRQKLAAGGSLRLRLLIRFSGSDSVRRFSLKLGGRR